MSGSNSFGLHIEIGEKVKWSQRIQSTITNEVDPLWFRRFVTAVSAEATACIDPEDHL